MHSSDYCSVQSCGVNQHQHLMATPSRLKYRLIQSKVMLMTLRFVNGPIKISGCINEAAELSSKSSLELLADVKLCCGRMCTSRVLSGYHDQ